MFESASGASGHDGKRRRVLQAVLRSRLLAVPALRARYLAHVRDIASRWVDWKKIGPMALRYQALIGADVKSDTHKIDSFDRFDAARPDSVKAFADERRAYLLNYTARP